MINSVFHCPKIYNSIIDSTTDSITTTITTKKLQASTFMLNFAYVGLIHYHKIKY